MAESEKYLRILRSCVMQLLAILLVLPASGVQAGGLMIDVAGVDVTFKMTSFSEARFLRTVKQEHDFSCGSAAVATLLSFHYEHAISEAEAFHAMYEAGDQSLIRRAGFSLLDIKRFLKSRGYESDGFRFSLSSLKKIGVPAVVLINDDGYKHFVVIKGVDDRYVLLGDPARGTHYMVRQEFEKIWNGIVFLVRNKKNIGEKYFDIRESSGIIASAPLGSVINRDDLQFSSFFSMSGQIEF